MNVNFLDMQQSMFKLTMKTQATKSMAKPSNTNPLRKSWVTITNNSLLCQCLNEYMKLAKIIVVFMLGSLENESTYPLLYS